MTDEELAEARATKFADINFNEPDNYGSEKEVGHFSYYTGFLAGLEAGRPKWHDLRKNPDDLPPRKGLETYSERLITDKGYSVYNFRKCRWYVDEPDCDCMVHREVVAWTEIPVFKEADNA